MSMFAALLAGLLAAGCGVQAAKKAPKVKNVILMIGDGMGPAQVYAGFTANGSPLNIMRCPFIGLTKTNSATRYTTDSAASGTAIATGTKTYNGAIGVDPDTLPVCSVLGYALRGGYAGGVVATSEVTHATPASFYAHQPDRNMGEAIAADLAHAGLTVAVGGGRNHLERRADGANYSDTLRAAGYRVAYTLDDLKRADGKTVALLADGHMPSVQGGRGNALPEATEAVLGLLKQSSGKGFFVMVEGSQIDFEAHANNAPGIAAEVIDFDRAVGVAQRFADENPGTLVVICADHETGGMTLPDGNFAEKRFDARFTSDYHTGVFVPLYAYGTGAEAFAGVYENTGIFERIMAAMGLGR
ncbi:MAG: alkaline phosphatase [Rikenellaceae bacterium]|nr:alkaline phosphatase [Rikenellaceae bacterium]